MPEPFFDLSQANLAGEAQIPAAGAVLACREFGHGRNSLATGITGSNAVSFHNSMVT